jgi:hypothetical protein
MYIHILILHRVIEAHFGVIEALLGVAEIHEGAIVRLDFYVEVHPGLVEAIKKP